MLFARTQFGMLKEIRRTSLFNGPNAYLLTAKTAVLIAEKVMTGKFNAGYKTPAMQYGSDLMLEISDTKRTDVS
jgi:hypothetical protein